MNVDKHFEIIKARRSVERQISALISEISLDRRADFLAEQLADALDAGSVLTSGSSGSGDLGATASKVHLVVDDGIGIQDRAVAYLAAHPGTGAEELAKALYPGLTTKVAVARTRTLFTTLMNKKLIERKGRGKYTAKKT